MRKEGGMSDEPRLVRIHKSSQVGVTEDLLREVREAMTDDDAEFAKYIRVVVGETSVAEAAQIVGVSHGTIERWAAGLSDPHPAMRAAILLELSRLSWRTQRRPEGTQ